jgi:hypothetical protein
MGRVQLLQVERGFNNVDNETGEVILPQPLIERRRHQHHWAACRE